MLTGPSQDLSTHKRLLKRAIHFHSLDLTNQGELSQKADLDLDRACESIGFTLHRNQTLSNTERVCRPCGVKIRNAAEIYNFIKRSASSDRPESNRTTKIAGDWMAGKNGEPGNPFSEFKNEF